MIPEKAEVVCEVYRRFADGEASSAIATDLRNRGIPTLKGGTWRSGNIMRIVRSKAPFGTLELGKGTKNKRTIIGEVANYFPVIISDPDLQRRVAFRLNGGGDKSHPGYMGAPRKGEPKRKTKGILTGVIWSPEKAGGNRAVARRQTGDSWAYVDSVTSRWVAKREVIERPFLEGWSEVVSAYETDTSPEMEGAELALQAAQTALEFAETRGSERIIMAAQADVEEAQRVLKELRAGQAIALQDIPDDISSMKSWEANEVVRRVVERVDVVRGKARQHRKQGQDGRRGKQVLLDVKLKNGIRLHLGDHELLFTQ